LGRFFGFFPILAVVSMQKTAVFSVFYLCVSSSSISLSVSYPNIYKKRGQIGSIFHVCVLLYLGHY
jgi:hypothetical protein